MIDSSNNMEPLLNQDKELGLEQQEELAIEKKIREEMRSGFVTKVYGIVLFQIAITTFFIILSQISQFYVKTFSLNRP